MLGTAFHELVDVLVEEVKDHMELVVYSNYFFEFDYVVMGEFSQRFYLSESQTLLPGVELFLHFFDSYDLAVGSGDSFENCAVGPVADSFEDFVSLHLSL